MHLTPSSIISHARDGVWSCEGGDVTRPFYKNRLHWIPDPVPPAPHRLDDLASPTSDPAIPTPPSEAHPRLPRHSQPHSRRKRRTAATANENSAPRAADLATPPTLSANSNSARWAPRTATQPRSSANDLPGGQPGTRSTPVKHPQSFTSSPLSQHPLSAANRNTERRSHLKSGGCINRPGMTSDRI